MEGTTSTRGSPGSYQNLDRFFKVLRVLCSNFTDATRGGRLILLPLFGGGVWRPRRVASVKLEPVFNLMVDFIDPELKTVSRFAPSLISVYLTYIFILFEVKIKVKYTVIKLVASLPNSPPSVAR